MQCSPLRVVLVCRGVPPPPSDSALSTTADESAARLLRASESHPRRQYASGYTTKPPHTELCLAALLAPKRPWFLPAGHPLWAGASRKYRHNRGPCASGSRQETQSSICANRRHHRVPATYPIPLLSKSKAHFGGCESPCAESSQSSLRQSHRAARSYWPDRNVSHPDRKRAEPLPGPSRRH